MAITKTPGASATGEAAALPRLASVQAPNPSAQGEHDMRPKTASRLVGTFDLPRLMDSLLDRASENLTDEDLESLEGHAEQAENLMGHIAAFTNGLACMVASDDRDGRRGSGSFQTGADLADLLFCVSALAEQAGALSRVAGWADGQRFLRAHAARHGISTLSNSQGELQ
ncbi:hypothetical protein KGA65_00405 [Ideonella sp. B7]|uniref:hypothetical protein n=1 Tax=Ideonella benzenivorans TaxID=2831643 RepID=UPI001CEDDD97|nr:hypothetical protein [Ideonella benzenivorans]MCA6214993.1 hypothetical protein [Ideonella benzenivorans]